VKPLELGNQAADVHMMAERKETKDEAETFDIRAARHGGCVER
jgi:hypothetical protein